MWLYTLIKGNLESKGFVPAYMFESQSIMKVKWGRNQDKNQEAASEAKDMEEILTGLFLTPYSARFLI